MVYKDLEKIIIAYTNTIFKGKYGERNLTDGQKWKEGAFLVSLDIDKEKFSDSVNLIFDDIELMPQIAMTRNGNLPSFYIPDYATDYNQSFQLSEILTFIYAIINADWDVIRAREIQTSKDHFYLESNGIVYDPSILVVSTKE